MAANDYYELIDITFEWVETALEAFPEDIDIRSAEGVINVTFENGVVFVFSRQPPLNSYGWRPQVAAFITNGAIASGLIPRPGSDFRLSWRGSSPNTPA